MSDIYINSLNHKWLDKAAIIESSSSFSPEEQEKVGKVCTVAHVKEPKRLLKMFPMFTSFLVFGMVSSAGDTFGLSKSQHAI